MPITHPNSIMIAHRLAPHQQISYSLKYSILFKH